jgi:hypothetical protein
MAGDLLLGDGERRCRQCRQPRRLGLRSGRLGATGRRGPVTALCRGEGRRPAAGRRAGISTMQELANTPSTQTFSPDMGVWSVANGPVQLLRSSARSARPSAHALRICGHTSSAWPKGCGEPAVAGRLKRPHRLAPSLRTTRRRSVGRTRRSRNRSMRAGNPFRSQPGPMTPDTRSIAQPRGLPWFFSTYKDAIAVVVVILLTLGAINVFTPRRGSNIRLRRRRA